MGVTIKIDMRGLVGFQKYVNDATIRAARMAGSSALRKMRAEASRRIRGKKGFKITQVAKAIFTQTDKEGLLWRIKASGEAMPVAAFAHRQMKGGVRAEINRGSPKLIPGAFIATMKSGHTGVFRRKGTARIMPIQSYRGFKRNAGKKRQPIKELFTTRVSDAFQDNIDAIAQAGRDEFIRTFNRIKRGQAAAPPQADEAAP